MAEEHGSGSGRERSLARMAPTLVLAALIVWFALANLQKVPITFWVVTVRASLITVIVIAAVLGAGLAALVRRRRRPAPRD